MARLCTWEGRYKTFRDDARPALASSLARFLLFHHTPARQLSH